MSEAVIIGAGPVGLWTAIQLKKRNPTLLITIYEKYEVYQRSHVLRLDYWSLILYTKQIKNERESQFYNELLNHGLNKLLSQPAKSIYIRTNDFEDALKSFAYDLGIKIVQKHVTHPDEVTKLHPNCTMFIAADGAKSPMRSILLGEKALEEHRLQHIVEVKYQVNGKSDKLNIWNEHLKTNKSLTHMAFEYVGKEKNGITPITLRFFLDKDTYEQIPEASFKNPLTLESQTLPPSIQKDIQIYMNIRKQEKNEIYKDGSSKISKLVLSLYSAQEFAIKKENHAWFLVGDSAMGVPYFRALNSGLMLGSRLSQILTGKIIGIPNNLNRKVFLYNVHKPMHIGTEFTIARGKNLGLEGYDWFRKMTSTLFPPEWDYDIEQSKAKEYENFSVSRENNNILPSDVKKNKKRI